MGETLLIAVLAAGASRRLGEPKQLVRVEGEPLLRRQCRIAIEAQVGPVMAVLGCRAMQCAAAIAGLPLTVALNEQWQEGLASSIREATRAARRQNTAGLLILHGDQYRVTAHDLRSLHGAWATTSKSVACRARHGNYSGPPVIFSAKHFADLLKLQGDQGARPVLSGLGRNSLVDVTMPNAIHDLDQPAQLSGLADSRTKEPPRKEESEG